MEEAAKDVALALVLRGYLEAQVRATAARRGAVADAAFDLRPGPQVRVSTAAVEGAEGAVQGFLRERIRPRPGEIFRRPRATEAAARMGRDLVKGGRWRARVEVLETYDPGAGRMGVVFRVSPGPRTRLEVRGAPLPGGLREAVEERLREGTLASDALEQGRELLEDHFRRRGHRDVAVSHREETGPDSAAVIYQVDPGAPTHATSVAVPGFSDLQPLLNTRPGQPLQDRLVEEDVRTLTRALQDRGYAQAKVEPEIPEGAGGVAVTFRVEAGTLTTVASFAVRSPEPFPRAPR